MASSLLLLLLLSLQLGLGQSSLHGQQHDPDHDIKVLFGEEVFKYNKFSDLNKKLRD